MWDIGAPGCVKKRAQNDVSNIFDMIMGMVTSVV